MKYRVIDIYSETGVQDKAVVGEVIGTSNTIDGAKRIMYEHEDICEAKGIECCVDIYDETNRVIYSY